MNLVARELGKDPAEVRLTNFIKPESFPHKLSAGPTYDSGAYAAALEKAMALIDYERLRAEQAQRPAEGKLLGIGLCTYVEICGLGTKGSIPFGTFEGARVRVEQTGTVMVYTGISPHGQGSETTFAQIVSEKVSNLDWRQRLSLSRNISPFLSARISARWRSIRTPARLRSPATSQ